MEENIVEQIRKFVEKECKKSSSKYGFEPYRDHFIPVVNNAKQLTKKIGGDIEIVEISAWLHDIGSIICGRENHHITGAEIAEKKLRELNYPEKKIEHVKKCIMNHRGSIDNNLESVEEQIIAEADTIDAFDKIAGLFEVAFIWEKKDRYEAKKSVKQKLMNKWNKLSEESKELIKPKYDAVILLLK
jgi:uncharacterized protein